VQIAEVLTAVLHIGRKIIINVCTFINRRLLQQKAKESKL